MLVDRYMHACTCIDRLLYVMQMQGEIVDITCSVCLCVCVCVCVCVSVVICDACEEILSLPVVLVPSVCQ